MKLRTLMRCTLLPLLGAAGFACAGLLPQWWYASKASSGFPTPIGSWDFDDGDWRTDKGSQGNSITSKSTFALIYTNLFGNASTFLNGTDSGVGTLYLSNATVSAGQDFSIAFVAHGLSHFAIGAYLRLYDAVGLATTNQRYVFASDNASINNQGYLATNQNKFIQNAVGSFPDYITNVWGSVIATVSSDQFIMYVNGTNSGSKAISTNYYSKLSVRALLLSSSQLGIDDIRIYDVTLSPSQVSTLHNEYKNSGKYSWGP